MNVSHSIMFDYMLSPYSGHSRCECGQYLGDIAKDEKKQKTNSHYECDLAKCIWFSF